MFTLTHFKFNICATVLFTHTGKVTQVLSVYTHAWKFKTGGPKQTVIYASRAAQTHKAFLFVTFRLLNGTTGAGRCVVWSKTVFSYHSDEQ